MWRASSRSRHGSDRIFGALMCGSLEHAEACSKAHLSRAQRVRDYSAACGVSLQRRTGAHQIAVAVDVVHPLHRRPVFRRRHKRQRKRRLRARIAVRSRPPPSPRARCAARASADCPRGPFPCRDRRDLGADGDHRLAKPVQFGLDSLSVGSIINVPATGHDMVGRESRNPAGAWRYPPPSRRPRPGSRGNR